MGILAIGMSFSAPIAIVGVLLHVLAHASGEVHGVLRRGQPHP